MWFQKSVSLPPKPRGCHLITNLLVEPISKDLNKINIGMLNVFIQHTSCSLTINENYDPDVRKDMEMMLNRLAPEDAPYKHDDEGLDDMPAHVKSSLMGVSLNIPISRGKLALGTWQGIWLCEHRDRGGSRNVIMTIQGE